MPKIFDVQSELHENPNRNNFDLTHKVHTSGKFGYIYPFLCQPVCPTDAWEIDTAIGVNLMPMWYPTQSNMRFVVHYFYVPNRLMCKDWKNTLEGLEQHDFPYLGLPASFYKTGSLADHLGVPTNYVLPKDQFLKYATCPAPYSQGKYFTFFARDIDSVVIGSYFSNPTGLSLSSAITPVDWSLNLELNNSTATMALVPCFSPLCPLGTFDYTQTLDVQGPRIFRFSWDRYVKTKQSQSQCKTYLLLYTPVDNELIDPTSDNLTNFQKMRLVGKFEWQGLSTTSTTGFGIPSDASSYTDIVLEINKLIDKYKYVYPCICFWNHGGASTLNILFSTDGAFSTENRPLDFSFSHDAGTDVEISAHPEYCPYWMDSSVWPTQNREKLRAWGFRAYEMVYNAFYRNWQGNQPFVVAGETKYNQYLPTDDSGVDTYPYELHNRNWELDAYTSCLPSPQQGDAPLVGVTVDGRMRVTHDDGHTSEVTLRDLDGSAGLSVVNSSIDPDHPEDMRTVVSLASSGLSIADFRAGNALQRFLEQSLRSGFRYADFLFGHFGKSPSHQELDMPVFLGGYTQVVDISKISNVAAVDGAVLGDFAGTGASFGGAKHPVKHYFDDFGIVLGVMSLVPDPAYSQVLPKHFTYSDRLDYYFPEFSQLGMQPITYEELCPIQSYAEYVDGESTKLLTDVFGYQRPNHDLVWLPDTCHGLFRTSLHDTVINRRFGSRPELGDDFLRCKPEECNGIFSVTEKDDDVWTGQVIVKISAQRPIPRVVIPSLGR